MGIAMKPFISETYAGYIEALGLTVERIDPWQVTIKKKEGEIVITTPRKEIL
jgi:hypothetical protein